MAMKFVFLDQIWHNEWFGENHCMASIGNFLEYASYSEYMEAQHEALGKN